MALNTWSLKFYPGISKPVACLALTLMALPSNGVVLMSGGFAEEILRYQ